MIIELSEYVIDAIANAVVKKMQEHCEDAISRQAVLEGIAKWVADGYADSEADISHISSLVTNLPSVIPTTCIAKIVFDKDELQKMVDEKVKELVTHGTCKDCSIKRLDKEESEEVGGGKILLPRSLWIR